MRITVDRRRCVGAGMCALTAPAVFDQDAEAGTVILLTETVDAGADGVVVTAAETCPARAITVE
ncbi:ferredoxin [Nocardia goodfellowii]